MRTNDIARSPPVCAKLIHAQRGGYCFEQSTLFAAVLECIGFGVTTLAGRVRVGLTDTATVTARAHKVLVVEADGDRWLADVGFRAATPLHPIRLVEEEPVGQGGWRYRLRQSDGAWMLQMEAGRWIDLYTFTEEPQYPIDYEVANHYTSTHPGSVFVQMITAQLPSPERQLVLRGREVTEHRPGGVSSTVTIGSDDQLLEFLDRCFGLRFNSGTTFVSPVEARVL